MLFWYVLSTVHNGGKITVEKIGVQDCAQKPETNISECENSEKYSDWFNSEKEARNFVRECRKV